MTPLSTADCYHVGLIVPDLDQAIAEMSAAGGYTWTKPIEATLSVRTDDGVVEMPFAFVYSVQAPHLELIQEAPDTVWAAPKDGAAHHLGYWVDDLQAAADGLEAAGFRCEARPDGEQLTSFAYYVSPNGVRVEIVDRALFPDFPGFLAMMSADR